MVIAFIATTIALGYKQMTYEKERVVTLITPEDIYLPASINKKEFGLFFYDENTQKITSENATFDNNKPVIIFFQANKGDNEENYNILEWQRKGYNVGCFLWQQVADDDPYSAEKKIWGRTNLRYIANRQGVIESKDTPKYSMAETFVAYYYDFMSKQDFAGGEIRFQGLSHGAQLLIAVTSYLMELEREKLIDKSFFPDRVTLFEAFFSNNSDDTFVEWLGTTIGNGGTMKLAQNTAKKMKETGIAIEYIRSSLAEWTATSSNDKSYNDFLNEVCLLDYQSDWLKDISIATLQEKHQIGQKWYNKMLEYPMPIDTKIAALGQYSISPNVPTSYIFARMGTKYGMRENETFDPSDDIHFSTNTSVPLVAGFAFLDKNENGNNDSRIGSRLDGIQIELYVVEFDYNRLIGKTVTRNGGFYQLPIEPIYVFNTEGREFFIVVNTTANITPYMGDSENWYMMTNKINEDKKSNNFFIRKKEEQIIINIGLTS